MSKEQWLTLATTLVKAAVPKRPLWRPLMEGYSGQKSVDGDPRISLK